VVPLVTKLVKNGTNPILSELNPPTPHAPAPHFLPRHPGSMSKIRNNGLIL